MNDAAWREPRLDLTPADLQEAGWVIQPYYDTLLWVARKAVGDDGCMYSAAQVSLDTLIGVVRKVYIAKQPLG